MITENTSSIRVDSDVPIPESRTRYPFPEMEPGDSFFLAERNMANSARVAAIRFTAKHRPDWKFQLRRTDTGWRLWRIS